MHFKYSKRKSGKRRFVLPLTLCVLIAACSVPIISKSIATTAAEKNFIKWVSFTPTAAALKKACAIDTSTNGTPYHLKMSESLAFYSASFGDGLYKNFRPSELDKLLERLKKGETMEEITAKLPLYDHYFESYSAVVGEFLGEYSIETEKDGVRKIETKYGLKAFSPIAKGYYTSGVSDFANSRTYGGNRKHLGHDMFGSIGTPIMAVESGIVEIMGWNAFGGWRVGIRSFDGLRYYYYAHLRKDRPYHERVKIGEVIAAGDVVGYLGATGYSTEENHNGMKEPHLHIGLQLIFHPSQQDGNGEIWIDMFGITQFLEQHRSEVYRDEKKEYHRKHAFSEKNLVENGYPPMPDS